LPGHPNQKAGRFTGEYSVGGFQQPSSLFSTLSSVIASSLGHLCSCSLLLFVPSLLIIIIIIIIIYSYLEPEDSLLGAFTLH